MENKHIVRDSDARFVIDPVLKVVKNTSKKTVIAQYSHNSERITIEIPRFVEEHDMSSCTSVEIHYQNIDAKTKEQKSGYYEAKDLRIDQDDEEKVICSWLISLNGTQLSGLLNFSVWYICKENGVITYAWPTLLNTELTVGGGFKASELVISEYVDVIEQWKQSVMDHFKSDLNAWKDEKSAELEAALTEWKKAESDEVHRVMGDYETYMNKQLDVERKRIDQFVALKDGSTTGDAELQDLRIDLNGIVHKSAGTAVREQFYAANKKLSVLGDFEADTSSWKPVNVIEGYSWGEAGYTYDNYGNLVTTEYTTQFTPLAQLIPAIPGASYQASGFVGQIRIYTADKTQLDLIYNNAMANQLSFTAAEDACYFGIYYRHDILNTEEKIAAIKLFRTTMTLEELRACPVVMINGRIPGEAIIDKSICMGKLADDAAMFISPLYGKTIVNFGDSIFGNARPPEDISTHIATLTGATVHNCGFGGCRMSYHPSANYDAFSMTKLADAVASKDFSVQDAAISSTDGDIVPGYFANSVELLKSIDFSKVDIITIAYGANDFNGVTLDNADNLLNQRTFAGALRYSIETILTAYPHIRIFVCSPTYRFWMDSQYEFTEDSDTKVGGANYRTTDITEKAKEVAAEYKLPYIDNYSIGINKFNRAQYFPTTDGAHHNINGRKLIAAHIAKELF